MPPQYDVLTPEQVNFFLEKGYVVIKNAFSREDAARWTENVWVRLNMDPNDKSTWDKERIHMPWHQQAFVKDIAPKAWGAICDLLGGEDRIDSDSSRWGDSFIVNLGTEEFAGDDKHVDPRDLNNWHVDGDFFVHFLDSPEQGLLVTPVWADIAHRGGGTYICPDGLDLIAHYLAKHPEGVRPTGLSFTPTNEEPHGPNYWSHLKEIRNCNDFVELTGEVGDVVLMHPLMLHSASRNHTRVPRIITNPPVAMKEPFKFAREDPEEYSLVERKTLRALGVDRLEFAPTTERRRVVPARVAIQEKLREEERQRVEALKAQMSAPAESTQHPIAVA